MVADVKTVKFIQTPHSNSKSTVTLTVVNTDNITMPGRENNFSAK
jgi:hypothetical protein